MPRKKREWYQGAKLHGISIRNIIIWCNDNNFIWIDKSVNKE